ncbi:TetR/AcrR family transcriptional regulator [Nocardia huaxiensis]|uniref:TetR/AcrR family transcriptional regulator n=1 Tax=Nocardia huaxiensis TaxID=2755382 RepID=A0A7D6ZMC6_9NOCA|nr:TetR/AcrR family transcriptional regulator [Nocardia huaxiensis]QLY29165.1 TetR/AcrR family transcriptional regulator [Nocardia huaxiensis]UFS97338.1 TetR/AcrR family transcriptional regulator [Nocardia huaxiensis]
MTETVQHPRARFKAQTRAEIKDAALAQLAAGGVASIALQRIAKGLGLSGPALYRYFDSKDALLTELMRDAYTEFATAIEAAAVPAATPRARLRALAVAYRGWAVTHPHRYLLIQGAPLPGYDAPAESLARLRAVLAHFLDVFETATPAVSLDALISQAEDWLRAGGPMADWVAAHCATPRLGVAPAGVLLTWSIMHGVVSLETAGQYTGLGLTGEMLLDTQITVLADTFGLR